MAYQNSLSHRFGLSLAASLACLCFWVLPLHVHAQDTAPDGGIHNPLRVEWPQDHSDIKPDPSARFGRLPNGMTYMIYRNLAFPGYATIHMRVAGGSMVEDDDQRGLAHLVEHMAFQGSVNVPQGKLLPLLQRHGFDFGADANAFTYPQKTEYVLALPRTTSETIDTALMIMRETAGNLLFFPDALERERQVVLDEERLRDTPALHSRVAMVQAAFKGQRYATRDQTIGLTDIVQHASRQTVIDYYHAFYRPELTTLVISGDINPDDIEARLKARFSDWQAIGPFKTVDFGHYSPKGVQAIVYDGQGLPDSMSLTWITPFDDHARTAQNTGDLVEDFILSGSLNQRFLHMAQQPQSALQRAGLSQQSIDKTGRVLQLVIVPKTGMDKAAFDEAVGALKQFATFGVTQSEIDTVAADLYAHSHIEVAAAKSRPNAAIINDFISSLDTNSVFTSPEQEMEFLTQLRPQLTQARLNARLKVLLAGDGPLLMHSAEDTGLLSAAAMKAAYAADMSHTVTAYKAIAKKDWPYTDFGPAVQPASHTEIKDLNVSQYVYPNGLKVNIKTTAFKTDQVDISVRFGGGLLSLPAHSSDPVFALALAGSSGVFGNGGLHKLNIEELRQALVGKAYSLRYNLDNTATTLTGVTTKTDYATQMQVLMAYTTDAGFDPQAFAQFQASTPNVYTALKSSPATMLSTHIEGLLHPDDVRFVFPTLEGLKQVTAAQFKTFILGTVTNTPIEIDIVGDISADEALAEVSRTFATLPVRPSANAVVAGADRLSFPTQDLDRVLYHQGRDDQSISAVVYPLPDFFSSVTTARGLEMLTAILKSRLYDQVREQQGQAYDVSASAGQSYDFKDWGALTVSASIRAGNDQVFRDALKVIIADLQAHPVTDDELNRARLPLLKLTIGYADNGYWLSILPGLLSDPRRMDARLNYRKQLLAVTASDVQVLAQTYLDDSKALHVHVIPQPPAPVATPIKPQAR